MCNLVGLWEPEADTVSDCSTGVIETCISINTRQIPRFCLHPNESNSNSFYVTDKNYKVCMHVANFASVNFQ